MVDCTRLRFALPLAFAFLTLVAGRAPAQVPAARGVYFAVPSPITSEVVAGIRTKMTAASSGDRPATAFVFDFNPADKDAATADFGPCYDLADTISKSRVRTVAYVHQKLTGHAVLPALTCGELVVGPRASVGEVVAPGEPAPGGLQANAYDLFVGQARPAQLAVARKMFDGAVQLRRGEKDGAAFYVDLRDRPKFAAQGVTVADNAALPPAPAGRVALLNAAALREFGVAQGGAGSRAELVTAYGIDEGLRAGGESGKTPVGTRYTLRGPVDASTRESVGRILTDAARNKVTVVILQLECSGGDPQAARELAEKLIELQQGADAIKVVAFVPDKAPDTAAIVALGCSEIVMSLRKDAPQSQGADDAAEFESTFGGFDTAAGKQLSSPSPEFWISSLRELAEKQGYPPLIVEGLINTDLGIVRVHKKGDLRAKRFLTDDEFEKDAARGADAEFVLDKRVKAKGQPLVLSASKAEEYGLAKATVPNRDQTELYARYGLTASQMRDATPAWLDRLANFIRMPTVTVLLAVIGFIGLFLEIKVPGTTIPGIIAALCFILVFWANTQFSGQVAFLAGMLFLLGLVLLLLEVFVLPGFGIPGILGILFMIGGLGLATVGFVDGPLPTTSAEFVRLGSKMAQYLGAFVAAGCASIVLIRYLPHMPFGNRMALAAPDDNAPSELPGVAAAANLLGAVGVTVTVLRPAGTVRLDCAADTRFLLIEAPINH